MTNEKIALDPTIYANLAEAALRERSAWDACEQIEGRRVRYTLAGEPVDIVFCVQRIGTERA